MFSQEVQFSDVPDVCTYINKCGILQQGIIKLSHQRILIVAHLTHEIHQQTWKYGFLLICCVPVVQQSSNVNKTLKMVSSYIFYQNIWFAHIWHTLKSDLVDFSKYGFHQYFKVLVEPAFFFKFSVHKMNKLCTESTEKPAGQKKKSSQQKMSQSYHGNWIW